MNKQTLDWLQQEGNTAVLFIFIILCAAIYLWKGPDTFPLPTKGERFPCYFLCHTLTQRLKGKKSSTFYIEEASKTRKMAAWLCEIMAAGSFLLKGNTASTKLFYTVWMQFASYFLQPSTRYFVPARPEADEKLRPQTFQLGCPWGKAEQMRTRSGGSW